MISVVDDALRAIVRTEAIDGSDVDVVFDAPTKDWAARRNAPTVEPLPLRHPRGPAAPRARLVGGARRPTASSRRARRRRGTSSSPTS